MNFNEEEKIPNEYRFLASSIIIMNIVTEITVPEEIEEYTDSIQDLRNLIYTVVGPRTEKVFTEVRILVLLIS